ncbi:MAG: hypothetical protein J7498_06460 [Sphingobium sp.]|nr:hypothetical protein [Sphingobium sp.]
MIRALIATAATAAVSSAAWYLYKSGKLDGLIGGFARPPALDEAYRGANASKPAPAHPWPIDRKSLAGTDMTAHAA